MQRNDQEFQELNAQRLSPQQSAASLSRFQSAFLRVVQQVDNDYERSESWCFNLCRRTISFVLSTEAAKDWEQWCTKLYQKYKQSNWKWLSRLLIGVLIGWLLGQILFACCGQSAFIAKLVTKYSWIKSVVLQYGSKILAGLGAIWNCLVAFFRGL